MSKYISSLLTFTLIITFMTQTSCYASKSTTFITIGTGSVSGNYYITGGSIAKFLNLKRKEYGIRCSVESTDGSVFNVNAVSGGDFEFGIIQSDKQHQAWTGIAEWKDKGPRQNLRSVFSIYSEAVTLVVSANSEIDDITDLRGKHINLGSPGSGQVQNSIDALYYAGMDYKKDIHPEWYRSSQLPALIQSERIHGFFFTTGHPSKLIETTLSGRRKIKLISISNINKLLKHCPYYTRTTIPAGIYKDLDGNHLVNTFGVKSTLVTSVQVPEFIVYALTKEVFENLDTFQTKHRTFHQITPVSMLEGLSAPIHNGALRYYKERGLMK